MFKRLNRKVIIGNDIKIQEWFFNGVKEYFIFKYNEYDRINVNKIGCYDFWIWMMVKII